MINISIFYEIYEFVLLRRKDDGGFGATILLPATIEDTFYAIEILKTLKKFLRNENLYNPKKDKYLINWLKYRVKEIKHFKNSPKILWYLCKISDFIKSQYLEKFKKISSNIIKTTQITHLEKFFYAAKLYRFFNNNRFPFNRNFYFYTIKDFFMSLWLLKNNFIKGEYKEEELLSWLRDSQNPDGGFGFFPETTSYIENTYFALKSYTLLNKVPENPYKILDFVCSCYVGKGGFARKPGGAPFLESTYYGVQSINFLYKFIKFLKGEKL